jgi:peptidoglycan/xylan/chitin deacetylase (PgdA/CDA1 family)
MILRFLVALISVGVSLFILFGGLVLLQPEWLFSRIRRRSPDVLYSVDTLEPVVALTIDDGPDSETTPLILDILAEHDAQGTFFLLGERVQGNTEIVQRMVADGHELGNHLITDEASINLPIDEFERQLLQVDELLSPFAKVKWMRPGSGWYNEQMLSVIEKHGYRCALGSVYPYDPQLGSSWFSIRYVLWKVKPGDIIVLHDYQSRGRRTVKALETILPELKARGYRIIPLSELVTFSEK